MLFWPKSSGCCCSAGCTVTITVTDCNFGTPVSGATVTVKDAGGSVVGSGTTNGSGVVTATYPSAGNYTIVVAKSGIATITVFRALACPTSTLTVATGINVAHTIATCSGLPIPGLTVTLTHTASGAVYTGITNSSTPNFVMPVVTGGAYTHSVSAFRSVTHTGSSSPLCGVFPSALFLAPAPGYHCYSGPCRPAPPGSTANQCDYAIADTLFLTDSLHGPTTLTWDANGAGAGIAAWVGTKAITTPTCNSLPGSADTLTYVLRASQDLSGNPNLEVRWAGGSGDRGVRIPCVDEDFCPPTLAVELDFALPPDPGGVQYRPYCDLGATFIITE